MAMCFLVTKLAYLTFGKESVSCPMGHINLLMAKNQQNHNHQTFHVFFSVCHPTVPKNCCSLHDPLHCLDEGWRNSRSCKGLHKGPSRWSLSGFGFMNAGSLRCQLLAPPAEKMPCSSSPTHPKQNTASLHLNQTYANEANIYIETW